MCICVGSVDQGDSLATDIPIIMEKQCCICCNNMAFSFRFVPLGDSSVGAEERSQFSPLIDGEGEACSISITTERILHLLNRELFKDDLIHEILSKTMLCLLNMWLKWRAERIKLFYKRI